MVRILDLQVKSLILGSELNFRSTPPPHPPCGIRFSYITSSYITSIQDSLVRILDLQVKSLILGSELNFRSTPHPPCGIRFSYITISYITSSYITSMQDSLIRILDLQVQSLILGSELNFRISVIIIRVGCWSEHWLVVMLYGHLFNSIFHIDL